MEIIGHSKNVEFLENAIKKNRVANAYLFGGIKGIGKFTTAKYLAKKLTTNPMDIYVIEPTYFHEGEIITIQEASENGINKKTKPLIRIEQIRDISNIVSKKPLGLKNIFGFAAKNVIIIDDIQNIQEEGINALLKNLEEPGDFTTFILVCSGNISDTITSRCQFLNFNRLSQENLLNIAKINNLSIEKNILEMCDGSYRQAVAIKDVLDEVPKELIKIATTLPTSILECLQIARDISTLPHHQQIILMEYATNLIWSKNFDKNMVENFNVCINKLKAGMQPRLTLEALFLGLVSS